MKMNQNFAENHFWRPLGLAKTLVCWTRFPTFVTLSFSMEKLTFWMFRNSIQKEHENPMKMNWNSEKKSFEHSFFVYIYMVCWTCFPLCEKLTFPIGKHTVFAKWETRSANQVNSPAGYPCQITSLPLLFIMILSADFHFAQKYVSNCRTHSFCKVGTRAQNHRN